MTRLIEIPPLPAGWAVYYLECWARGKVKSVYCGSTSDLNRRMREHQRRAKTCKYTRQFGKVVLGWYVVVTSIDPPGNVEKRDYEKWCRSQALRAEIHYKHQTPGFKRSMCKLSGINVVLRDY